MFDTLNQAFNQAENAQTIVVLTGQPCMLSGGYDLKVTRHSVAAAMALIEKGTTLTRRMLSFPYTLLLACSGHAASKGEF